MKPSLGLSQSEWHPAFEDSIHRSAAGKSTILSEKFLGPHRTSGYPGYIFESWLEFSLIISALEPPFSAFDKKNYLKPALFELNRRAEQYPKQAQDLQTLVINKSRVELVFPAFLGPLHRHLCREWAIYIGGRDNSPETILEYDDFLSKEDLDEAYDNLYLSFDYAKMGYDRLAVETIEQILNLRSKPANAQSSGLEHSYDRISRQPATPENSGAYDPCLTEAARWEELEG